MIDISELRRLAGQYVGMTAWSPASPKELIELLDRLEAAEKERDSYKLALSAFSEKTDWVQRGVDDGTVSAKYLGWHRADVMSDLLSAVEKDRDALRDKVSDLAINVAFLDNLKKSYEELIGNLQEERDELRVRIAAMEQQEPAMWVNSSNIISARISTERGSIGDQHTCSETKTAYHDTPLYLGAQGE